jgi:hypothetical protein
VDLPASARASAARPAAGPLHRRACRTAQAKVIAKVAEELRNTPAVCRKSSIPSDIDLLYGLEPVFEPGENAGNELDPFAEMCCPYCGEVMAVRLDLSAGSHTCVEDCQVCCQPIQMSVTVADDGSLDALTTERMDR